MAVQAKEQGFTMIELIVVITILGILAAFALPRFVDVRNEARAAAIGGLGGSLRSASAMVHAKALVNPTATAVPVEDQTINLTAAGGYAKATDIGKAVQDLSGFTATSGTGTVSYSPASASTPGSCYASYTEGATAATPPTISVYSGGCS